MANDAKLAAALAWFPLNWISSSSSRGAPFKEGFALDAAVSWTCSCTQPRCADLD